MSKFNVSIPKIGYGIAYASTGSIVNKLIVKRQLNAGFKPEEAKWTHIEIAGPKVRNIRYSVNITTPIARRIDIVKKHKGRYACVLRYKNEHYERIGRFKVAWFAATLCNKPYDLSGILAFVFKWIRHNNRFYFCSEGFLWAFRIIYSLIMGALKPDKCMVAHIIASKDFEVIWEGIIE